LWISIFRQNDFFIAMYDSCFWSLWYGARKLKHFKSCKFDIAFFIKL